MKDFEFNPWNIFIGFCCFKIWSIGFSSWKASMKYERRRIRLILILQNIRRPLE